MHGLTYDHQLSLVMITQHDPQPSPLLMLAKEGPLTQSRLAQLKPYRC